MSWPGDGHVHVIATVGAIPQGLPLPRACRAFDWSELDTLLPLSLACFLLGVQRRDRRGPPAGDAPRNTRSTPTASCSGSAPPTSPSRSATAFPSAGGLSQSLVNDEAGARSPVSIVVCSAWMAIVLLFLTGLFDGLPQPLLAALVLASVQGMFKIDEMRQLRRVSKAEFVIAMVTIAAVLGLGILKGVLVACVSSRWRC